ncbi:MAG: efflux RND transporter permease subunit [Candidatus Omnitrophica bacterium]|nr:efflux RND transporter permease subunit [Candidatus Omnitrophota bacterium]
MGLPDFSIQRPITILMGVTAALIVGAICVQLLPIELLPNISFGDITIFTEVRGGIPPTEVESQVTRPIEEAMSAVTNLSSLLAISKEGESRIVMSFEPGTDMDYAALEVREKFEKVKDKLPSEVEKPVIAQYDQSDVPIITLAISSPYKTTEEVRKIVDERIKERFQRIPGVANVEVVGGRERKILVEVDQRRLQAYGIPIQQVVHILGVNNLNLLSGELEGRKDKLLVRTIGEYKTLDDIRHIGVTASSQGVIIRLKDIARIEDSYLEPEGLARIDAKPVVAVYIQRETTANILKVSQLVKEEIERIRKGLGEEIIIFPVGNEAEFIQKMINVVLNSLVTGALLSIIVLLIFLRSERPVFIIGVTIPISVVGTFGFMMLPQLTLNMMTLFGLALGIGMLVDNSIVVLDNVEVHRDRGEGSVEAARHGAGEMAVAIIASTITTVVIFLPIIFANEEIKLLYQGVGLTITFSLLSSLIVALTLVPLLISKLGYARNPVTVWTVLIVSCILTALLTRPLSILWVYLVTFLFIVAIAFCNEKRYRKILPEFFRRFEALILFLLGIFFLFFVLFFLVFARFLDRIGEIAFLYDRAQTLFYRFRPWIAALFFLFLMIGILFHRSLNRIALRYRYLCVALSLLLFGLCLYTAIFKIDKEFLQTTEENDFTIFVELPTGAKLDISDKLVTKVEEILKKMKEIKTFQSRIERWSSKIYVTLVPQDQREKANAEVIDEIRPQVEELEPAFIYFEEPWQVGSQEVIVDIYGYDYEILEDLAKTIYTHMASIPGLTDAKIRHREGRPEIKVVVDKQKASFYGLDVAEIAEVVHAQMRGLVATRYHTEAKEVETIARLDEKYRKNLNDVRRLTLTTPKGEPVYLEQVASFVFDLGPSEIWRKNKARMIQVSASKGKLSLSRAVQLIKGRLDEVEFPKDYFYHFGGNYDRMVENQSQMIIGLVLSLILVYLVLASLFESFFQPFIIMMSVPQAATGVVAALKLAKIPISIGVYIAAWLLGGIVVNNAIILVDAVNRSRKEGVRPLRAILTVGQMRLRPIMMTTTTTLMGLLPLTLYRGEGSTLLSPTAVVLLGGLSSSTVLTLFIVPSMYLIFEETGDFFRRVFRRSV